MATGRLVLCGDREGFLAEQLRAEGISFFEESATVPADLGPRDLVFALSAHSPSEASACLTHLKNGGRVVVIQPAGPMEKALGLERRGEASRDRLLGAFPGRPVQIFDSVRYDPEPDTLFPAGDGSGVFLKKVGTGRASVLAFDFVQTQFLLTHGRDLSQGEVDRSGVPRIDFGRTVKLENREVAQADALRRMLAGLIEDGLDHPCPRLWYLPHGHSSAVALSHDSDSASLADLREIGRLDASLGVKATVFLRAIDGRPWAWRKLAREGLDLQLHPVLHLKLPGGGRGPGSLRLPDGWRDWFFGFQKRFVETFSGGRVLGVRNHGLVWPGRQAHFEALKRLGVQYDGTCGSNLYSGYMYGTGLPYLLRFPDSLASTDVLEMPMHVMDSVFIDGFGRETGLDPLERISGFIDEAVARQPSLVSLNFHYSFLLARNPAWNNLGLYKNVLKYMASAERPSVSLGDMNEFWRSRMETDLIPEDWDPGVGRLSFRIRGRRSLPGLTVALPAAFRGARLVSAEGRPLGSAWLAGREYRLFGQETEPGSVRKCGALYEAGSADKGEER